MPLCQRPWSLNGYALPLIWYKCHSVDLREGDISKMSSCAKSWLYHDMLEKPSELILYRTRSEGGLGMHHIRSKSRAILTKSFLETSVSNKYIRNHYHNALFRWHVLEDKTMTDPGCPSYYSGDFFQSIKEVIERTSKSVDNLTSRDWYKIFLERNVTMEMSMTGTLTQKLCKREIQEPALP